MRPRMLNRCSRHTESPCRNSSSSRCGAIYSLVSPSSSTNRMSSVRIPHRVYQAHPMPTVRTRWTHPAPKRYSKSCAVKPWFYCSTWSASCRSRCKPIGRWCWNRRASHRPSTMGLYPVSAWLMMTWEGNSMSFRCWLLCCWNLKKRCVWMPYQPSSYYSMCCPCRSGSLGLILRSMRSKSCRKTPLPSNPSNRRPISCIKHPRTPISRCSTLWVRWLVSNQTSKCWAWSSNSTKSYSTPHPYLKKYHMNLECNHYVSYTYCPSTEEPSVGSMCSSIHQSRQIIS